LNARRGHGQLAQEDARRPRFDFIGYHLELRAPVLSLY
jgi:hypothetical protein